MISAPLILRLIIHEPHTSSNHLFLLFTFHAILMIFSDTTFTYSNFFFFPFLPCTSFLCSVCCSVAVSPELPPRYLLGQTHRPNTITHVCWYRNQSLSLSDYLCMIQVNCFFRSQQAGIFLHHHHSLSEILFQYASIKSSILSQ